MAETRVMPPPQLSHIETFDDEASQRSQVVQTVSRSYAAHMSFEEMVEISTYFMEDTSS